MEDSSAGYKMFRMKVGTWEKLNAVSESKGLPMTKVVDGLVDDAYIALSGYDEIMAEVQRLLTIAESKKGE